MSEPGYLYVVERPYILLREGRSAYQTALTDSGLVVDHGEHGDIWGIENPRGPVGIPELVRVIRVLRAPL